MTFRPETGRRAPAGIRLAGLAADPLPELDPDLPPWPGRFVAAQGASLFVRTTPAAVGAEPALYVHGLAGASTNWTDLAGYLAPQLAGEAIDLPGFGRSGPAPGGNYSIRNATRTVIDHLERSGRGPVHLFGNSMGGAIAISIAARRPDLVRTLTLISPAVPDLRIKRGNSEPLMALLLVPGPISGVIERRMALVSPEQRAAGLLQVCFADPSRVSPQRRQEAIDEIAARQTMPWVHSAFTRSLRGLVRHWLSVGPNSVRRELGRISAPTLVVWGDRDQLVDVSLAPRVARAVPDSRLLVLPGVGHTAQLEDPRSTARAFLAMLAETDDS